MKIRSTSPVVFTNDSSNFIAQMEALGFHVNHEKNKANGTNVIAKTLKDDNDHSVAVVEGDVFTPSFAGIRINVDNFDEALKEFTEMGYTNARENYADTGTSHVTLLRSPEGIFVSISEHIG